MTPRTTPPPQPPKSKELEAAEILKIEADIEQAHAESDKARAEAAKIKLEARKTHAEALASEIALREFQRKEREILADDDQHHIFRYNNEVSAASVNACIRTLNVWSRNDPKCDIEIVFCSPGGSVIHGLALFDYLQELRAKGHKITTKAQGYAASMAGILLQAGDDRVMDAESWLLIHEAAFLTFGKIGEVEDTVEWIKKVMHRVKRIFASRSLLTPAQIETRWRRKDWWIDSDEALKLGLCDRIDGVLLFPHEDEEEAA